MSGGYSTRATADLDDATPLDLYRAWFVFRDAGADEIEARVSSGGEGFHVRAFWTEPLDDGTVEALRREAGDHVRRILLDRDHLHKPGQMLFTEKPDGSRAGKWRPDPWAAADDLRARSSRYGWESVGL